MTKRTVSIDPMEYVVPTKNLVTPSGMKVTIREQNGEDDDVISNISDSTDGTALNKFISRIVTDVEGKGSPSLEDVLSWKVRDKYYILLNSRILSLGEELVFEITFGENTDNPITQMFEENLSHYNWDFSKGFPPKKGEEGYNPKTIQPYENGKETHDEFTLSSGKEVRYEYSNGYTEKYILSVDKSKASKNLSFTSRNLQLKVGGKWQTILNFSPFTPRDMRELRTRQEANDPDFDLFTYVNNPKTGQTERVSIFNLNDFFFPKDYPTPFTKN